MDITPSVGIFGDPDFDEFDRPDPTSASMRVEINLTKRIDKSTPLATGTGDSNNSFPTEILSMDLTSTMHFGGQNVKFLMRTLQMESNT